LLKGKGSVLRNKFLESVKYFSSVEDRCLLLNVEPAQKSCC
jgi:hypothetical protein